MYFAVVYYSVQAGVNFSIIMTIFALTPFVTALAFRLFFKEKLAFAHFGGILLFTVCITCISFS